MYLRELQVPVPTRTGAQFFPVALFIVITTWKQWMDHHHHGHYWATENELLLHVAMWINLKTVMLSERSQTQKAPNHI
jgi:hypothetical protein